MYKYKRMFGFGQIIHNDNASNNSKYKEERKQSFKTYKFDNWNESDKVKQNKKLKINNFKDDDTTPSVKYYDYVVFEPPEIAEPKYQIFKGAEYEKQYDVEKGRYNNITPSDLLYKAYQENDTYGLLGRDPNELRADLMARIALDDPNEDQIVQGTLGELVLETPAARSIMKKKAKERKLDIRPLTREQKRDTTRHFLENLTNEEKNKYRPILEEQFTQVMEPYNSKANERDEKKRIKREEEEEKKEREESKASLQIQKATRGLLAKRKAQKLKTQKRQEKMDKLNEMITNRIRKREREEKAATQIQKIARGIKPRKEFKEQKQAATQIQKIARGYNARNKLDPSILEQHTKNRKTAAIEIQKTTRGLLARRKAQKLREEEFRQEQRNIERQEHQAIRNKKLGIVDATVVQEEEKLPEEQIIENIGPNKYDDFKKFILGTYKESTFNTKTNINDLISIIALINKNGGKIDYQGKTKKQMITEIGKIRQIIRDRIFSTE